MPKPDGIDLDTWEEMRFLAKRSFPYFCDFTLRMDFISRGRYGLDDGGPYQMAQLLDDWRSWRTSLVEQPRTTGKSTRAYIWNAWMHWNYPYLQSVIMSSTPAVASDAIDMLYKLCTMHPMLDEICPRLGFDPKTRGREFDHPGGSAKGKSFRCITPDIGYTGIRGHILHFDDLEVKETVATPRARQSIRLDMAEAHNLLYPDEEVQLTLATGTPWDDDTIYNGMHAERTLIIPAISPSTLEALDSGKCEMNYPSLSLAELRTRRVKMNNDRFFRAQYLLDASRKADVQLIKPDTIIFEDFQAKELHSRVLVIDPAGTKDDKFRAATGIGEDIDLGDDHVLIACGLRNDKVYVLDVWAETLPSADVLRETVRIAKEYMVNKTYIEGNFGGWDAAIRPRFQESRIGSTVETFPVSQNKTDKVVNTLGPLFADRQVVFHRRLMLTTAVQVTVKLAQQLADLRQNALPHPHDDIVDCLANACRIIKPNINAGSRKQEEKPEKRWWKQQSDSTARETYDLVGG